MNVRRAITGYDGIFFITITCSGWRHLFHLSDGYAEVYKWFDHLKGQGHYIVGYVIMPNHMHALIGFRNTQGLSINSIIGEGKRFMSFGIVRRLRQACETDVLSELSSIVHDTDRSRGKRHEVFEPSFDWKECMSDKFICQKLDCIHANPCKGNWALVADECDYIHSSAKNYQTGNQGIYDITSWTELKDIDLTKAIIKAQSSRNG